MLVIGIKAEHTEGVHMLVGFDFGASLATLFAQLSSGIYTKAADNVAGISQTAGLGEETRKVGEEHDAVGNVKKKPLPKVMRRAQPQ